jgi:hypothetical protein
LHGTGNGEPPRSPERSDSVRHRNLDAAGATSQNNVQVFNNNIINSSVVGVHFFSNYLNAGTPNVFRMNNISGGANVGMNNESTTNVDASFNYWGADSGPSGQGSGTGSSVTANVDFNPILRSGTDTVLNAPFSDSSLGFQPDHLGLFLQTATSAARAVFQTGDLDSSPVSANFTPPHASDWSWMPRARWRLSSIWSNCSR